MCKKCVIYFTQGFQPKGCAKTRLFFRTIVRDVLKVNSSVVFKRSFRFVRFLNAHDF